MQRKAKILIILAILGVYTAGYVVCRSRGELIRRMTYSDNDRAIHRIAPGSYENRIQFILEVSDEDLRYARRIQITRSILHVVFLPISFAECVVWSIIKPKYK